MTGAFVLAGPALALSGQYETPPEQDPAVVLDGKELGPGYAVLPPVRSDGFLRIYQLQTDLGVEQVEGDGLLKLRLSEMRVLVALEGLKKDASFMAGLKQAAMKPVDFVGSTVTDPVGTAKKAPSPASGACSAAWPRAWKPWRPARAARRPRLPARSPVRAVRAGNSPSTSASTRTPSIGPFRTS
ncbi:hypothetical protein QW131_23780 [Roseibium salinum]|nr:hypothetical protein [Roseibium salinum]